MSIDKRGPGQYRVRWRETAGGPQKARTFNRKEDAQRFLTATQASLLHGTYIDPAAGKRRLDDYARRWAEQQPWRPGTRERMVTVIEKHIVPRFGSQHLRAIATSDVRAWVGEMSRTLAPSTVESYYRVLVAIMRAAVIDKLIVETPCREVKLPRRDGTTTALVPLTVDQVNALADAVPERYRALVLVSAIMGLRQGEARGLTLDRVGFLRRRLTIDRQLISVVGRAPEFGPPKTPASNRTLPLPDVVGEIIAEHVAKYKIAPTALLFTMPDGRPIGRSTWGHIFRRAASDVGLDSTPHDLRHHAASLLIARGCSVKAVQTFLGHATAAETLDTYGHLWPDDDDRIRAAMDAAYAAPAVDRHRDISADGRSGGGRVRAQSGAAHE